jgi:hypothetical protein
VGDAVSRKMPRKIKYVSNVYTMLLEMQDGASHWKSCRPVYHRSQQKEGVQLTAR